MKLSPVSERVICGLPRTSLCHRNCSRCLRPYTRSFRFRSLRVCIHQSSVSHDHARRYCTPICDRYLTRYPLSSAKRPRRPSSYLQWTNPRMLQWRDLLMRNTELRSLFPSLDANVSKVQRPRRSAVQCEVGGDAAHDSSSRRTRLQAGKKIVISVIRRELLWTRPITRGMICSHSRKVHSCPNYVGMTYSCRAGELETM